MGKLLDTLDHPIVFLIFMTFAIYGTGYMLAWGAGKVGLTGIQAFFGH